MITTCYELVIQVANLLWTCYGEVANLLRTCYGETGVMDFGLYHSATNKDSTSLCRSSIIKKHHATV